MRDLPFLVERTLESAMGKMAGTRRAIMFSGGFDSMLMALMARRCGAQVTAVTVQFDDFNPLTVAGAAESARQAGIKHCILHVKPAEFLSAFGGLAALTEQPMADLDLGVVYAALKKYDPKTAGNVLISGMGSDQWFGNEALQVRPQRLKERLQDARRQKALHLRVAEVHGCKFIFPFLSEAMLALAQEVPAALKKDKKLLRALAIARGIPHRTFKSEIQVPAVMRRMLITTYGRRKVKSRL
ncbi:MAG: 7-cyano-7-deazaguanine synthase [Candidatus Omnitrophica bacterium]|nr:7-cyano-7-deazaguanine synthase [Candidatus Omnitrophota bacterium]